MAEVVPEAVVVQGDVLVDSFLEAMNTTSKRVFREVGSAMVKIFSWDGKLLGTGFYFSPEPSIITAHHVLRGLLTFYVISHEEFIPRIMTLAFVAPCGIDVAILSGGFPPHRYLRAAHPLETGEHGYAFGYDCNMVLSLSSGIISQGIKLSAFGDPEEAYIACHSDNCYSGGPITSHQGFVKGMILGDKGLTIPTTRILPVSLLNVVIQLYLSKCPGQSQ